MSSIITILTPYFSIMPAVIVIVAFGSYIIRLATR
jgi:hypothetical protein